MTLRQTYLKIPLLLLLGLSVLAGCADLSAIKEFANISSQSADYTALVNEYVAFPSRQKRYMPVSQHSHLTQIAADREIQKERLLLRLKLIDEYMQALGQLAADDLVNYDTRIDALGKAVSENKFADPKETGAFADMAKVLTRAATDAWRKSKIKELVEAANGPLQIVIKNLKQVVDEGFGGDIETEKATVQTYYRTLVMKSADPAGIEAVKEWEEVRLASITERQNSIRTYSQILTKISEAHQKLYDNRHEITSKILLSQIQQYAKDLGKLYKDIKSIL